MADLLCLFLCIYSIISGSFVNYFIIKDWRCGYVSFYCGNIKKIALEKNLTIKQIGKESGVGENAIYRWDKQNPNLSSLKKVSNYLNISIDELLESEKQEV